MKKWMYNILIFVFVAVFVASGAFVGCYYLDALVQEKRYSDLAQLRPITNTRPAPTQESPENTEGTEGEDTQTEPSEPAAKTVEVTDPKTGEKLQILVEFAELYKMNSDLVGWMSIPGVGVDYPVVQTPDDPEYYLRRTFDKEKNTRGCLFVEAECDVLTPSDNVTIYGHRMKDGTMFGQLKKYKKKSFRDENPYIYFDSLTELHTYEVMAVFLTTASVGQGFRYHAFIDAEDAKEFDNFVSRCKKLSYYDTGVTAKYGDKLICLSTCDYSITNGRLVVVAKQVA